MIIENTNSEKPKDTPLSECENKAACVDALMSKLFDKSFKIAEGLELTAKEWRMFYRLQMILHYYPEPQPAHVDEFEAGEIKAKQKHHNYSTGDLAFIFIRSKSTILEVLNRQ